MREARSIQPEEVHAHAGVARNAQHACHLGIMPTRHRSRTVWSPQILTPTYLHGTKGVSRHVAEGAAAESDVCCVCRHVADNDTTTTLGYGW